MVQRWFARITVLRIAIWLAWKGNWPSTLRYCSRLGREFMESTERYIQADRRGHSRPIPRAIAARYDRRIGRIVLSLESGLDLSFSPRDAEGLELATVEQLRQIELSPSGQGIHFPALDADLYIPALLEGFLGSRRWMAARMGAMGGKAKSAAKSESARRNGRLGGRPRKNPVVAA